MQGILACCNPIPPIVRQHLNVLHQIVLKAREQPLIKPMTNEGSLVRSSVNLNDKKDLLNHPLYCPHDLSHQTDRDDLPTLLGSKDIARKLQDIKLIAVKLSVFDKSQQGLGNSKETQIQFISPYHRYKLMIPFMEEQRKKEAAAEEERRKQLLEEKKKQLPALEIVKISDSDLYQTPLKELKKRPFDQDPNEKIPISNKRWKKETPKPEVPENPTTPAPQPSTETPRTSNKKKNRGKPQKAADFRQSSNKAVNFDYSQVNYQRFQGGSGSGQQQGNGIQQKFKGGGKKNKAHLDKMFSFSNFRLNKRK